EVSPPIGAPDLHGAVFRNAYQSPVVQSKCDVRHVVGVAGQSRALLAGEGVPKRDRAVVTAAGQSLSIGRERQRRDAVRMGPANDSLAGGEVPEADPAREVAAGQRRPVERNCQRLHFVRMAGQSLFRLKSLSVVDTDDAVSAAGGQDSSVGTK